MNLDGLTVTQNAKYPGSRDIHFPDGHEYKSYCKCAQCSELTASYDEWHEKRESEAAARLVKCRCGRQPHFHYEGVVHLCVDEGLPSNGMWVSCDCGLELGCSHGMTSQEDVPGNYEDFDDAVEAWNSLMQ